MRIFVTGVAGFLGSHLAEALVQAGHEVGGCDTLVGGDVDNVPAGVRWSREDCNDLDAMRRAVGGAEVVYHLAAAPYEGVSVFSPHYVTQSVVTATTGVLSAAVSAGVKRFVFASSMARYGAGGGGGLFHEDTTPTRPQDPYGIGKLAAERLVENLCEVHGLEWAVAVPHNIYGPKQRIDPYRNVVTIFLNRALRGLPPIIYGDGRQRRCFSYVSDVVEPLVRFGTDEKVVGAVVNLGPDRGAVTILELAHMVAEVVGTPCEPVFHPARLQEVRHATCSAEKARRLLDYADVVPLREGLRRTLAWLKARGPEPFRYHLPLEIVTDRTPKTWTERLL